MCAWLKPASCQQDFFNPAIIFGNSLKVYFCLEPTNTTGAHSRQGVPETTEQQQSGFRYQLRHPKFLRWTSAQATRFASFVVTYTDSTHRGETLSGMPTCIAATSRSPEDISSGSLHVWDLWLFLPPSEPTSSYTSLPEQSFPSRGQAPSSAASRPDSAHRHQENTRRCIETLSWPLQSQHRKYCYQKYQQIILEAFKNWFFFSSLQIEISQTCCCKHHSGARTLIIFLHG